MQEATTLFMRTLGLPTWGREAAPRTGIYHGGGVTATYPCAPEGDEPDPNDWVFIMVVTSQMWDSLCTVIERPDLIVDERFETPQARMDHRAELYEEVAGWTRQHAKREVMSILGPVGVPVSYVFSSLDLFTDPHLVERDFIQTVDHPINGPVQLMRNPIRMPGVVPLEHSPVLDNATDEVLSQDLGLDQRRLAELRGKERSGPRSHRRWRRRRETEGSGQAPGDPPLGNPASHARGGEGRSERSTRDGSVTAIAESSRRRGL